MHVGWLLDYLMQKLCSTNEMGKWSINGEQVNLKADGHILLQDTILAFDWK